MISLPSCVTLWFSVWPLSQGCVYFSKFLRSITHTDRDDRWWTTRGWHTARSTICEIYVIRVRDLTTRSNISMTVSLSYYYTEFGVSIIGRLDPSLRTRDWGLTQRKVGRSVSSDLCLLVFRHNHLTGPSRYFENVSTSPPRTRLPHLDPSSFLFSVDVFGPLLICPLCDPSLPPRQQRTRLPTVRTLWQTPLKHSV